MPLPHPSPPLGVPLTSSMWLTPPPLIQTTMALTHDVSIYDKNNSSFCLLCNAMYNPMNVFIIVVTAYTSLHRTDKVNEMNLPFTEDHLWSIKLISN